MVSIYISVVYQWKTVVKFGGITSGIPVEYQWYNSGMSVVLPVVSSGIPVVKFDGNTTDITVAISGINTVYH